MTISEINIKTGKQTQRQWTQAEKKAHEDAVKKDKANLESRPYDVKRMELLSQLDGEGMDAIRKEIAAIRAGEPETNDYKQYRLKVEKIKADIPKSSE